MWVYRKAICFDMLTFYLSFLLSSEVFLLIVSNLLHRWLCHLLTKILVCLYFQSIYFLIPFLVLLYYLGLPVWSKSNDERRYNCFVLDLSGKGLSFSPLAVDFFVDILYQVEVVPPLFLSLRRDFITEVLDFVKHFFCTTDMILWFSFLACWYESLHELTFKG